jgi:BMFP domain-containing protein YqiC
MTAGQDLHHAAHGPNSWLPQDATKLRGEIMTSGPNRILDDFAKLMTDAAGVAQSARREVETAMHAQMERMLSSMDVVQREEFEAVREMAALARDENEALKARIETLEKQLEEAGSGSKQPARSKKAAARTAEI